MRKTVRRGIAARPGGVLLVGGDLFPVAIHGPGGSLPLQETDNEDGTYTVRYTPPAAGNYTVKVTYEGRSIAGSPYQVAVQPA